MSKSKRSSERRCVAAIWSPWPGYPDEADKAFFTGGHGSLDCATRAQGYVPFDRVGEVVHLPQVHVVDAHTFQGTL